MNKFIYIVPLIAVFLLGFTACESKKNNGEEQAQQTNQEQLKDSPIGSPITEHNADQAEFVTEAASSNMFEVEAGKLAQQKAQNQEVKSFGEMMASDHKQATTKLKSLASKKDIALPDSMSYEHKDKLEELRKKQGAEFDRAYINIIVDAHDKDINMFKDAAENIEDQEIKSFASSQLPVLRQHLDQANQIKDKLKNNTNNSSQKK